MEDYKKETKHHFDVVAERIEDKIVLVAEQVATNTERLTEHDKNLQALKRN